MIRPICWDFMPKRESGQVTRDTVVPMSVADRHAAALAVATLADKSFIARNTERWAASGRMASGMVNGMASGLVIAVVDAMVAADAAADAACGR